MLFLVVALNAMTWSLVKVLVGSQFKGRLVQNDVDKHFRSHLTEDTVPLLNMISQPENEAKGCKYVLLVGKTALYV